MSGTPPTAVVSAEDFAAEREVIVQERRQVEGDAERAQDSKEYLKPWRDAISRLNEAPFRLAPATPEEKLQLVRSLTCNLRLHDKKLIIKAKNPYDALAKSGTSRSLSAWLDHVETEIRNSGR